MVRTPLFEFLLFQRQTGFQPATVKYFSTSIVQYFCSGLRACSGIEVGGPREIVKSVNCEKIGAIVAKCLMVFIYCRLAKSKIEGLFEMRRRISVVKFISLALFFTTARLYAATVEPSPEQQVESCGSLYRDGEYQKALDCITSLLPTISQRDDSITALKYCAFSAGMLSRIDASKAYFKMALDKFPEMDVDTLECPPNISIIFKQVKLEAALAKIDTTAHPQQAAVVTRRSHVTTILLLCASAGSAGVLAAYGYDQRKKYRAVGPLDPNPQSKLDMYYRNYTRAFALSAVCGGISVTSLYFFIARKKNEKQVQVTIGPRNVSLTYSF
jgi:hypothetical protein